MSSASINSDEYKHYKFIDQESLNHPDIDKDLDSSFSSSYSHIQPSQVKSEIVNRSDNDSVNKNEKSFFSEPVYMKQHVVSLTEEELARHNTQVPPLALFTYPEEDLQDEEDYDFAFEENEFMRRLEERCNDMQREFDEKFRHLEEQFSRTEEEFNQSKQDMELIDQMQKEYISQGIQTDLGNMDMQKLNQLETAVAELSLEPNQVVEKVSKWKANSKKLKDVEHFVEATKKIVWDKPFVPLDQICRQLPTAVNLDDIEDDQDICEFHREKYEKAMNKARQEKELCQDSKATLTRLSRIVQN